MKKALVFGLAASFFFAFTFVLNRSMNLQGGYWLWSASLRYLFTLPMLAILLLGGGRMRPVIKDIAGAPVKWFIWSSVGFGLFYAPLSAASVFAESWFVASAWQFTIIAGMLLTPLFGKKLPVKNLLMSGIILAGIFIMQLPKYSSGAGKHILSAMILLAVAAFSYPLGNRKMMQVCRGDLSTLQRVFGMTLCSMPFWILCSAVAMYKTGLPSAGQTLQAFCVAAFSGVAATLLFFRATDMVKQNPKQLAVIEATQSGEVIFTLLLGVLVLHDTMPSPSAFVGIGLIVLGMIFNSLSAAK